MRNPLAGPPADRDPDYPRRAAYAYPSIVRYQSEDQPLRIDNGHGEEPLTIELALPMFERQAREVLRP